MVQRLLLLIVSGCIAAPALAQGPSATRNRAAPAPLQDQFWVQFDAGLSRATSFSGVGANIGLYSAQGRNITGLRWGGHADIGNAFECLGEAFSFGSEGGNCKNGGSESEAALLVGQYFDNSRSGWIAAGIARVDAQGERAGDRRQIGPGLALELAIAPHFSWIGAIVRLNGDLNERNSFGMISFGWRIGNLN